MAIKSVDELKTRRLEINLTGPDGNAWVIMGYAKTLSKQLGIDHNPIINDMMSDDYEHLIDVFEKNFGDYVDIYR